MKTEELISWLKGKITLLKIAIEHDPVLIQNSEKVVEENVKFLALLAKLEAAENLARLVKCAWDPSPHTGIAKAIKSYEDAGKQHD